MATKGDFTSNLGKVYGVYTGSFAAFVVVLAILEQMGVPPQFLGYLFVGLTIAVYAAIGIMSRTMEVSEYYVAGRRVPAFYNGMATGADWMSAASFIGMAGTLYLQGYDGLAFVLGWTGGYVLVAVLLAPYLHKFGAYTVPDFLGARYGGNVARFVGVVVLMVCSFAYIVAQVYGTGIIAARLLGLDFNIAIFVGLAGILVCSMLGGMRAVTWTQVAQYIILIVAYLIPVVILSGQVTGVPVPQLMYGTALEQIGQLESTLGIAKPHVAPFAGANGAYDPVAALNFFSLIACLMLGTAALPHVLMRFFTTPSVREARLSVGWSLLFIFLLYFTAPAYAAFAKLEVYQNVIGKPIAELPQWIALWGRAGIDLVGACDAANAAEIFAMCKGVAGNADGILQASEFRINADAIVLATPEIAGLPYVISGLVAAGGLAAALSTADGLLLAIANALSHDVYYRMIDPKASTARRLVISRILLVLVALLAAYTAAQKPAGILAMVAWAFSIAASGLFPALVLGVWWKRTTTAGAVAGMITGFVVCLYYLIMTQYYGMPLWFGVKNISCGLFGIPAGFLVTIVVSLMTPAPSKEMQDFIDQVRIPGGGAMMDKEKAGAMGH
ncbi:MAG TPA: sodium:solute symporter family protein [Alphaproteobacteria bacterium]|nr:sodium:solute symporter family protein [Alphaproteobacteria bacterium]